MMLTRTICLLAILSAGAQAAHAQMAPAPMMPAGRYRIDLELQAGTVFQNNIQRPNNALGTRFSANSLAPRNFIGGRVEAVARLDLWRDGDELRLVVAPFMQSGSKNPQTPIRFDDAMFGTQAPASLDYRFNTYRITYDLPIFSGLAEDGWHLRLGGTLALRDARIRLGQSGTVGKLANQGPVPLLYVSATKDLGASWRLIAEADGFPAPGGGGLFDGSLKMAYDVSENISLTAGYRYQFGGATGKSLYNGIGVGAGIVGASLRF